MADELQNNLQTETTPETTPAPETPVDTGRDVDELRHTIEALRAQTEALTAELRQKAPAEEAPKVDFGAYFAQYMK